MTTDFERPLNVHERLGLMRMTAAKRREAITRMQRAEAIADLALSRARLVQEADQGRIMTKRRPLIESRLDPVSQRRLVEAVLVGARQARAETIRDLLVQAAGFIYRTSRSAAQIVRKIIRGLVQTARDHTSKSLDWEMWLNSQMGDKDEQIRHRIYSSAFAGDVATRLRRLRTATTGDEPNRRIRIDHEVFSAPGTSRMVACLAGANGQTPDR